MAQCFFEIEHIPNIVSNFFVSQILKKAFKKSNYQFETSAGKITLIILSIEQYLL